MNKAELLKNQATQDQAQIHNLQLRLARAVARAEKAEAELKAMGADQKPLLYIQFSNCGAHIRFWTKNMDRMQAQQAAFPEPEMVALYARPIPSEWRAAVIGAREQFQHYADLHLAKGTQDGDEKAQVNQDYADMLTALLNNTSAPAQTTAVTTDEWREVMQELADDAEFACDIQYPYRGVYPGDMVKYHAEMAIVRRARGLLERAK